MQYVVVGQDGESVEVEAFDWMMAMVQAIEKMGIEVSGWACQTRPDGSVVVTDPMTSRWWEVRTIGEATDQGEGIIHGRTVTPEMPQSNDDLVAQTMPPPDPSPPSVPPPIPTPSASTFVLPQTDTPKPLPRPAPDATPRPAPRQRRRGPMTIASFEGETPLPVEPRPEPITATPPPAPAAGPRAPTVPPTPGRRSSAEPVAPVAAKPRRFRAPTPAQPLPAPTGDVGPPEDLAERLFDLSFELSSATDGNDACRRALNICLEIVPCEAGSVLRGGLNHAHLTFVAVAGPAANQLLGRSLPFGQGIIGASFDLGITIQVDDVQADPRHVSDFDSETGFRTRSVLSVPVQGRDSYHGAIQLLNPASIHFQNWHRDALEQLASSLASTLDGAAN